MYRTRHILRPLVIGIRNSSWKLCDCQRPVPEKAFLRRGRARTRRLRQLHSGAARPGVLQPALSMASERLITGTVCPGSSIPGTLATSRALCKSCSRRRPSKSSSSVRADAVLPKPQPRVLKLTSPTAWLSDDDYLREINTANRLGSGGELAEVRNNRTPFAVGPRLTLKHSHRRLQSYARSPRVGNSARSRRRISK